jgi:hypothetical protein
MQMCYLNLEEEHGISRCWSMSVNAGGELTEFHPELVL